ncbi:MAG: ABC transporter permease [Bacteroidetes bacterium]|nr:ABC transporter permease [Bacteroidota bacterium]
MEFEIKPQSRFSLGLQELWTYRELFYFFTLRDIKVKYKQTALGVLWAIFQPAIMTLLFTLGFGKMISANSELQIPYPVFALSGFLLWNIFSSGLSNAGNSMVNNANIIKKIYFPRLIIPVSSVLVSVVDFCMAFLVFIPVLLYYHCSLNFSAIIFIPLSVILAAMATFGLGTFLAAVNVKYRDFRYILPFFIQALLFATPVIYPIEINSNKLFQLILQFNPMNAPIALFRAGISGYEFSFASIVSSVIVSFILFATGIIYFRKTESYFADLA